MSGTFPSSPAPSSLVLRSIQPTRVSTSHNLKRQVRGGTSQRWEIDLQWSPMPRSQAAPILAFFASPGRAVRDLCLRAG